MSASSFSRITRPAPPPLDRGAEEADQILGLLLDLDVAVADDPEGAAAEQFVAGEELGDLAADHGLDRRRSAPPRRAGG